MSHRPHLARCTQATRVTLSVLRMSRLYEVSFPDSCIVTPRPSLLTLVLQLGCVEAAQAGSSAALTFDLRSGWRTRSYSCLFHTFCSD